MARIQSLDARQKPPESIKASYKFYQTLDLDALSADADVLDFSRGLSVEQKERCKQVGTMHSDTVRDACIRFGHPRHDESSWPAFVHTPIFEHEKVPGLLLVPSLVPQQTQKDLLSHLMHQALADQRHKTNVHLHYRLPYQSTHNASGSAEKPPGDGNSPSAPPLSFFNICPESPEPLQPLDPRTHNPLTAAQFLRRKLRWITLGGQYNWTTKLYPADEHHPPFPADIADLVHSLFPDMTPEAAIVNLYTPGDTLSVHRDVSENTDRGLVSISLGCDGILVAGFGEESVLPPAKLAVRLRSGDAVYMSGSARFAWHGVPKVIPNTCPQWLSDWPAENKNDEYESWRGWMADKRINLNIRQIRD